MDNNQQQVDAWLLKAGLALFTFIVALGFVYYTSSSAQEGRQVTALQQEVQEAQEAERQEAYKAQQRTTELQLQALERGEVGPPKPTTTTATEGIPAEKYDSSDSTITTPTQIRCTDTDNGYTTHKVGEVYGATRKIIVDPTGKRLQVDDIVTNKVDSCIFEGDTVLYRGNKVYTKLKEYYCDGDGRISFDIHACAYGCLNGTCLPHPDLKPTVQFYADGNSAMVRKVHGSTVTLTWTSTDAGQCSAYSSGGATESWTQRDIGLSGTKLLRVSNITSSTEIRLTCEGTSDTTFTSHSLTIYSQNSL